MKTSMALLGLACLVALAGCSPERPDPSDAATVKNGTIRTAPVETYYIAVEGPEEILGDVPLPIQPYGFVIPEQEPLTAFGASIGYDERHHVSAFRMTESLQLTLKEFIQAHSSDRVVQRLPELSAYADYEGSALNGTSRADFFVAGESGDALVRVTYDTASETQASALLEMARRLIAYPTGDAPAERPLFEEARPTGATLGLVLDGVAANAAFVPFLSTDYGLYVAPPLRAIEREAETEVGLSLGEYIGLHPWSLDDEDTAYDRIAAFEADAPIVLDRELSNIPEYRATKMNVQGVRHDFFLYTDAANHVLVALRYFDESKEEVLPLLLETASTLRAS